MHCFLLPPLHPLDSGASDVKTLNQGIQVVNGEASFWHDGNTTPGTRWPDYVELTAFVSSPIELYFLLLARYGTQIVLLSCSSSPKNHCHKTHQIIHSLI